MDRSSHEWTFFFYILDSIENLISFLAVDFLKILFSFRGYTNLMVNSENNNNKQDRVRYTGTGWK